MENTMSPNAIAGAFEVGRPARQTWSPEVWSALRTPFERLLRNTRAKRAAREFEQLDERILKDIGFTRLGVRETALANRLELDI